MRAHKNGLAMEERMNRISSALAKAKATVENKNLSPEIVKEMSKNLDMDVEEYCRLQELKSIASLDGRLTLEEAQHAYQLLGNTLEHFNGQPLHVKWVLTEVLVELLEAHKQTA